MPEYSTHHICFLFRHPGSQFACRLKKLVYYLVGFFYSFMSLNGLQVPDTQESTYILCIS